MSKEAMKLALEALERHVQYFDYEQFTSVCELDPAKDAITALREALADIGNPISEQPAQPDKLISGLSDYLDGERYKQPAQPQEPVAWIYDWLCDGKLVEGWIAHKESEIPKLLARNIRSLYTSPPAQRKPLTDEQYREIANQVIATLEDRNGVIDLSFEQELVEEIMLDVTDTLKTAFEAAHGIKEQP